MKAAIEMQPERSSDYSNALNALEGYKGYDADKYPKLAKHKEQFIKWVKASNIQNAEQPDLSMALHNTYYFFKKEMEINEYKKYVQTMIQKSSSPRLKYVGITLLGLGLLALPAGVGLAAAFAVPGFVWLGCLALGLLLVGMPSVGMGMWAFMSSQPSVVSLAMETIANTAVKTGFISSTATAGTL